MFGSILDSVTSTVSDFVEDPVGKTVEIATQPIVDGCDLLDGLTEGEFRERAALRLGADVVAGMAISEVIEALD
jgi:hypothetical protein